VTNGFGGASIQRRFAIVTLSGIALTACNALFGVDDLTYEGPAATSTAGSGGTSATGSGTTIVGGGGTTGQGGGATGGSGGGPSEPCGQFSLLADDFDDDRVGELWREATSGSSIDEDGELFVSVGTGLGTQYAELNSRYAYDLRESSVTVQVTQPLALGTTYLEVYVEGSSNLELRRTAADALQVRSSGTTLESVPFDASEHLYWRIREQGGTLFVEAAGANLDFAEIHAEPATTLAADTTLLRYTQVQFGGAEPQSAASASFDDFNGGTASGQFCKTGTLVSTFDEPLEPVWVELETGGDGGCVSRSGDSVRIEYDAGGEICAAASSSLYDFAGSYFSARVDRGAGDQPGLRVASPGGDYAELVVLGGDLTARVAVGDIPQQVGSVAYAAASHVWLRLREQAGSVVFETSTNGTAWSTLTSAPLPFAAAPVQMLLFVDGNGSDQTSYFDDVNVSAGTTP
jgi:hypothetical protein